MGFLSQIPRRIGNVLADQIDPYSALTPPAFEPSDGSPFEMAANRRPPAPPTFGAPRPAPMPPAPAPLDAPPQITPGMPQQAPPSFGSEPRTYTGQMADQREDLIRNRQAPPELRGFRKYASAFIRGGPMGVAQTAIMGNYPEQQAKQQFREQQAEDLYNLSRQRDIDTINEENKRSIIASRQAAAEDRDLQHELTLAQLGASPVGTASQPGQEPPRFRRFTVGGHEYEAPTPYGRKMDEQAAIQSTYREIPPKIAEALGMAPGTKVPPTELDAYVRMMEARASREANETLRRDLAAESAAVRREIAQSMISNRQNQNDYRNTSGMARDFRNEQSVKDFQTVNQSYKGIVSAAEQSAKDTSGAGDITLMRLFAKLTDPTTGVREEEYRTMQGAGGALNALQVFASGKWLKGQKLTPETRQAFVNMAQQILQNRKQQYDQVKNKYARQAQHFNVDPSLVFNDEDEQPKGTSGPVEQWTRDANGRLVKGGVK